MDFQNFITEQLKKGMELEDIGKQMADAMNEVRKKNLRETNRKKYLDTLEATFHDNYAREHLEISDVAALATLVLAEKYPSWSKEDCSIFFDEVRIGTLEAAKRIKSVQSLKSKVDGVFISSRSSNNSIRTDRDIIEDFIKNIIN